MANRIDRIFILDGLNRAKTIFIVFVLMQVLGATSPAAKAQADTDPLETIGVRPVPDFLPIPNGHVDLSSGDLHIDIPLGTFSQRGRSQVTTSLLYDSAIWSQGAAQWTTSEYYGPLIGWQFATPAPADLISNKSSNGEYCTASKSYDWINLTDYSWTGPDGTVRSFPLAAEQLGLINKCGTYASSYKGGYAGDASGYYLNLASTGMTVYSPDGTIKFSNDPTIDPSGGAIDANGNYLTAASPAVVDTLERNPVTETTNGNTITYGVLNSKREYSNYIVTTEVINVWTDFDASGSSIPDSQGTLTVIESIELPDGTSYSFGYDSGTTRGHYGQLTSMTLPTGGQITYTYENFADSECCFGHITRGINTMTTPDGKWTLTPAVIVQCSATVSVCEQSMTVAEPSGDTSVHTFDVSEGTWPIQVQYYTGPVASANLLMTQTQTFNNLGGVDVTKASETVTLPIPGGTSLNRTTQYVWDTSNYGNLMKKMEWNFYTGSLPASADRTTSYSYQTASNYISKNILKLVTNVTVTDKKSNTVAQTANSFDGASSLTDRKSVV